VPGTTGAAARGLWNGDFSLSEAADASWQGALLGLSSAALHPTTYQYWRTRADVRAAAHIENAHKNAQTHHQRNVATRRSMVFKRPTRVLLLG